MDLVIRSYNNVGHDILMIVDFLVRIQYKKIVLPTIIAKSKNNIKYKY